MSEIQLFSTLFVFFCIIQFIKAKLTVKGFPDVMDTLIDSCIP